MDQERPCSTRGDAAGGRIPRTQKFFTRFRFRFGKVIHRRLRRAMRWRAPRRRMNNFEKRIRSRSRSRSRSRNPRRSTRILRIVARSVSNTGNDSLNSCRNPGDFQSLFFTGANGGNRGDARNRCSGVVNVISSASTHRPPPRKEPGAAFNGELFIAVCCLGFLFHHAATGGA
jgi:hypothetical protein